MLIRALPWVLSTRVTWRTMSTSENGKATVIPLVMQIVADRQLAKVSATNAL